MTPEQQRASLLLGGIDESRPDAYAQYGYPQDLVFNHYYRAYSRTEGGYAAVHRVLEKCWASLPTILDSKTELGENDAWSDKLHTLLNDKQMQLWARVMETDRRNMVGRYAGMVLLVADNLPLNAPLQPGGKLVGVVPLWESQLTPTDYDPVTGDVTMYQFASRPATSRQPTKYLPLHPSRVIIFAEGASAGDLYDGVPLLRAGYNRLVDMEKINGGSGEAFLKNAGRQVVIEFSPDANVAQAVGANTDAEVAEKIEDRVGLLNHNINASLTLQNGKAYTLQTTLVDTDGPWTTAATAFAASVMIPFTVLFGQQTGRLASDEDQKDWAARCDARRLNFLTPRFEDFILRLIVYGLVEPPPSGDFKVVWQSLMPSSMLEQMTVAEKMANINKTMMGVGEPELPYPVEQIRQCVAR